MRLLKSKDGYSIEVEPEIYAIGDFAKLAEARRKNLDLLYKELAYIYFFCDMSSDFQFQTNEAARDAELKKYLDMPTGWKRDDLVSSAMETYIYLSQTASSRLLQGVYIAVDKIKAQLESIDLNERDKGGKPIWNIKQIHDTIKGMPDLMMNIEKAEKQFIKSQKENGKLPGNKQRSLYDGQDLGKI